MSKEDFKLFVRNNPVLADYVNRNEMTWQKFYDMYNLYGNTSNVWDKYLKTQVNETPTSSVGGISKSIKELVGLVKGIDLDSVQRGVTGIQKAIGLVQDLGIGTSASSATSTYEPRPIYKHFED